ncbi:hypothetical protein [Candidatus Trichorickettsia mobilis]|uniref:hypothetical protein n=1 Tax=Candidatus Trichorickettsia mobilis TaxID=1346319 RepID=UPI00293139E7|nr:hypothetical protein [Candidatus Trichorickettsia mobilis]
MKGRPRVINIDDWSNLQGKPLHKVPARIRSFANSSNKSLVEYETSIQTTVEQFLENGGSGDDLCNKHLSDIIGLFRIKFNKYLKLSTELPAGLKRTLDNLQNTNELTNDVNALISKFIEAKFITYKVKILKNSSLYTNELDDLISLAKKFITARRSLENSSLDADELDKAIFSLNQKFVTAGAHIKQLLENSKLYTDKLDNELDNIVILAKKLIIVGADIDYETATKHSILYELTHVLDNQHAILNTLDNEYKLAVQKNIQQKLGEIFACIIANDLFKLNPEFACNTANDLFKLNPEITKHLIDIKECLEEDQFAALQERVTNEFINMMQQSPETVQNVEQSLNFIEQINPELMTALSELKTVKLNIGCMLLNCLGLSTLAPELLKTDYSKDGDQFVLNSMNSFSGFSQWDQNLHIKTLEFYEKYPARIDQLLDIVANNPELKEQLIANLQQNSGLRTTFQD